MKKVINGKLYDTNTAKELGVDSYSYPRDFNYWREELYIKRTGEYFLYGEGGPMSRYSKSIDGNSWSGSEQIIPMTPEAAREWAEEHLDGDDYEKAFGTPNEGENVIMTVQVPAAVQAAVRAKAQEAGVSVSEWLRTLIDSAIK